MSICRVFSCVVGRGRLLWPVHSLGKTLLAFAQGLQKLVNLTTFFTKKWRKEGCREPRQLSSQSVSSGTSLFLKSCAFYLRSSLRSSDLPLTFLCSICVGFSLPCLLATAILDSCFLLSKASGIFLDQGLRLCPLHWQMDSLSTVPPGKSDFSLFNVEFQASFFTPLFHPQESLEFLFTFCHSSGITRILKTGSQGGGNDQMCKCWYFWGWYFSWHSWFQFWFIQSSISHSVLCM